MPRYNGAVSYPIEVLLHLLWCYAIFALGWIVIAVPFVLVAAINGHFLDSVVSWARTFTGIPLFFLLGIHLLVLASFRFAVWPRFPYAPALLTFALITIFGSVINSLAWPLEHCRQQPDGILSMSCLQSIATDPVSFWSRVKWFVALSVVAGLLGRWMFAWGAVPPGLLFGLEAWIGRALVGREVYDAFLGTERARVKQEYDDHRKEVGQHS